MYSMPLSNTSVAMTGKQVLDARRWSNDTFTKHRHSLLGLSADWSQTHSCPLGSVNASCFVFTVLASGGLGGWGAASTAVSDPRRKHSSQVAPEEPATVRQGTEMSQSQKMEHTPTPSTGSTINYHNQLQHTKYRKKSRLFRQERFYPHCACTSGRRMFSRKFELAAVAIALCALASCTHAGSFNSFLYLDGDTKAYWYVIPGEDQVKIFFQHDFANASSVGWVGIGFHATGYNDMGPGVFYTGQTDTLEVTARKKSDSGNGFPAPWTDATVVSSGCEMNDGAFTCYVIRDIDGSDIAPNVDLATQVQVLHAHGDLDGEDIAFHGAANCGIWDSVNVVGVSPALPSIVEAGVINVQWSPTPFNTIDVYMTADFAEDSVNEKWVGFGVGESGSTMGRGEFYTGQSDTLQITDRFLDSGDGYPPPVNNSNIITSGSSAGPQCSVVANNLTCSFSRPLTTTGSQTVSMGDPVYVLWAVGDVANGGIEKHSDRAITGDALPMYNISAAASVSSNIMYQLHAIFMIITWLWLLPFGIYVARFRDVIGMGAAHKPADAPPLWWRIHQPVQYLGVLLLVVSATIIFVTVGQSWGSGYPTSSFTKGAHQIAGLVSIILAVLQPVLAMMRNGLFEKDENKKKKVHSLWHVVHAVCGYSALLAALVSVALGIEEYNFSETYV